MDGCGKERVLLSDRIFRSLPFSLPFILSSPLVLFPPLPSEGTMTVTGLHKGTLGVENISVM